MQKNDDKKRTGKNQRMIIPGAGTYTKHTAEHFSEKRAAKPAQKQRRSSNTKLSRTQVGIKLFAHFDKMRILEYLTFHGVSCVSNIVKAVDIEQLKVSQYLKKMREDEFVKSRKDGRFVYYDITKGIHKSTIGCIHKRYNSLENKNDF